MTTTNYIWDEQNYLAEADETNTINVVYTNEPQQYGNLISTRLPVSGTPTTVYHHFDALGSTRQLSTTAGAVSDTVIYDAWGNAIDRTGTTAVMMLWVGELGYYFDPETGLVYVRARIYGPGIGRWTSVDPLRFVDGMNFYVYAADAPQGNADPSGTRHLRPPADPAKCSEAVFLMTAYATLRNTWWPQVLFGATYDQELLSHYLDGSGTPLDLPIDAFDPSGSDRRALRHAVFNALKPKPTSLAGVPCGGRLYAGASSKSHWFTNKITRMISSYRLDAVGVFWYRKKCGLGRCLCFIDYSFKYSASDMTDFNPGDSFGFGLSGVEYLIDDQLIRDCNIGKSFSVTAVSVDSGTWLTPCIKSP